jgi:hypothetical protein
VFKFWTGPDQLLVIFAQEAMQKAGMHWRIGPIWKNTT